jgi:hypothetical protein
VALKSLRAFLKAAGRWRRRVYVGQLHLAAIIYANLARASL